MIKNTVIIICILVTATIASCSSTDDDSRSDKYSRQEMLTNWADNIIMPGYVDYEAKVQLLNNAANEFSATPQQIQLENLRTAWLEAYKSFQKVSIFNIGKAEEIYFRETANTYPTDVAGIQANIVSGDFTLNSISQFSKQGFPALDYMLFGTGNSDSEILANYNGVAATEYKSYLTALTNTLLQNITTVISDWNSGYRNTFVANDGNSVSSSVNIVTNKFVQYLEKDIRTAKIGIPAGVFSNGNTFPNKVEAYYNDEVTRILIETATLAAWNFFQGKHYNGSATGESLRSYLNHVNAVRTGQNLSDVISNQFALIMSSYSTLSNSLSQQVNSDNSMMLASYDVLQQNVVYLKLDMMQALNITIDYVDSDGD